MGVQTAELAVIRIGKVREIQRPALPPTSLCGIIHERLDRYAYQAVPRMAERLGSRRRAPTRGWIAARADRLRFRSLGDKGQQA